MLIPLGFLGGGAGNTFELISTQVLASSVSSVTFSSIPNTYKHLQLRITAKKDTASRIEFGIQFNGDAGSNYLWHRLTGNGTSVASGWYGGTGSMSYIGFTDGNSAANIFAANIIDIFDYTSTSKNKSLKAMGGVHNGVNQEIRLSSGAWLSTSAVSSLTLTYGGYNFVSGSRFSLYGVKG